MEEEKVSTESAEVVHNSVKTSDQANPTSWNYWDDFQMGEATLPRHLPRCGDDS